MPSQAFFTPRSRERGHNVSGMTENGPEGRTWLQLAGVFTWNFCVRCGWGGNPHRAPDVGESKRVFLVRGTCSVTLRRVSIATTG
jgi:hypothetical protein